MFDFFTPFFSINHTRGIQTENNEFYLIDLANTPDYGWEIARNKIDVATMQVDSEMSIVTVYDMLDSGEDYCNDLGWEVISRHKTEQAAMKAFRKICNAYAP